MRYITSLRTLAIAAAVAAAAPVAMQAQATTVPTTVGARAGRRPVQDRLFTGITLSASQRAQIKAIRGPKGQFKAEHSTLRTDRQNHDVADAKTLRAQMKSQHEARLSAIRAILTPDQRARFDANVAQRRADAKSARSSRRAARP